MSAFSTKTINATKNKVMMMERVTPYVTVAGGVTTTGKVSRNIPTQPVQIRRIPFVHTGWSVVGSRPGTQRPDSSIKTTNLNLLDTTKHNAKDTVNRTTFSPVYYRL